jgi:SAM-dependent methyltransferase
MKNKAHPVDSSQFWDERYRQNATGWELGTPTPAFVDCFSGLKNNLGSLLVLGSGSGHDAIWLAQQGYKVTGVDFSLEAVHRSLSNAKLANVSPTFLRRDVFELSPDEFGWFDIIVEYVTFCAINPSRRAEFVRVVSNMLRPGGTFVGLFFPLDNRSGGPPFAVNIDEIRELFGDHFELQSSVEPARSVSPRMGKEMLMIWIKNEIRTHETSTLQ